MNVLFRLRVMKKLFFCLLIAICVIDCVRSAPVDPGIARLVAKNMYYEKVNIHQKVDYNDIQISDEFKILQDNITLYYVFNVSGQKGWVTVSADNATIPVLSYSFEGAYGASDAPENFVYWMSEYRRIMLAVINAGVPQSPEAADLWAYYTQNDFQLAKSNSSVAPLLGSIAWGQGCYYNELCPADTNGYCGHTLTGCLATAMAMIMKYHEFPLHGTGSKSFNSATYGLLSANFANATYNWDAMPDTAISSNPNIAQLMSHCGVAVQMNYSIYGSGSYVIDAEAAFKSYFSYKSLHTYKSAYTDADWKALIIDNLDKKQPILYAGQSSNGGHAFVLDGYQGSNYDYYHFNWGWDGAYNSYNYISCLVPGNTPIMGNFVADQEAVLNITPDRAAVNTSLYEISDSVIHSMVPDFSLGTSISGNSELSANLIVYPNPASDHLTVDDLPTKTVTLYLYNALGALVYKEMLLSTTRIDIPLGNLPQGSYLLKVECGFSETTKKILVVH